MEDDAEEVRSLNTKHIYLRPRDESAGWERYAFLFGRENSGCVAMIHSCWGWHTVDLWRDKACSQDLLEGIYPGYWAESIGSSRSFFLETTAGDHRWYWCEFVQNTFVGGQFFGSGGDQSFSQFWNGESAYLTCKRIIPGHCAVAGEHKCAPVFLWLPVTGTSGGASSEQFFGTGMYTQAR